MDKNTLTGLLLMAAVMFGFFWFTKPSDEEIKAQREKQEQAEKALREAQQPAATLAFDSADSISLINAVKAMGTPDASGRVAFTNDKLQLAVDSLSGLSGTYTDGDVTVDINDLLAGRATLASAGAARATKAVHSLVDKALRYEGFARYLSGDNKEYVLENDLVKVTLNTRGARVGQVELKKYKTELTDEPSNILLFRDDADGYGFRFNTAEQRIDTRDFNFSAVAEGDSAVLMTMEPAPGAVWGIRYTLAPDGYTVRMDVVQQGMAAVLPGNTSSMDFAWHQKMARNERGRTFEERNSAIYYKYIGESLQAVCAGWLSRTSSSQA